MNQILELPMMPRFGNESTYNELSKINNSLGNRKTTIKVINKLKTFTDFDEEDINNKKIINMFDCFKDKTTYILEVLRKYIDNIHQLKDVLPKFYLNRKDEYIKIFNKIQKYKKEDFLNVLYYINFPIVSKLILNNKNKKEIILKVEKIKNGILKASQSRTYRNEFGENYKEILNELYNKENNAYISKMDLGKITFTKDPVLADYWGKETKCCLKKGGLAEKLINVIQYSPIAGELVGTIEKNKMSSYVWEYIELIDGKAYKNLVLDNIESPNIIKAKTIEKLFDKIMSYGKYKKLYIGDTRNDVELKKEYLTKKYERQSVVPGFDNLFKTSPYMSADSKELYKLRENKTDNTVVLRKMNYSDLHLCKYIERYIYGNIYKENDKTDILKEVTLDTPCYILDSDTNIWGYVLTKWKYLDDDGKELSKKEKDYKKLYIEDIVLSKNRNVLLKLDDIILDFVNWCFENNITEVYANTNKFSKNLVKRLNKFGIKVKKEQMESINPQHFLQ